MTTETAIANQRPPAWQRLVAGSFSVDLRSLALLRMGLAIMLLSDLVIRAADLTAHYTDAGIMPLELLRPLAKPGHWTLYSLNGSSLYAAILFVLSGLSALLMLVGYHTRIVTITSWVLLISLQNRNPALLFAADAVLRALMFWAMFLPLGACYSVDSAMNTSATPQPKQIVTGATIALIVQQCFIYMFSAAIKAKSSVWLDGTAVYYALSYDQYVTPLGQVLLKFPVLMTLSTHITMVLEIFGPLLLIVPFRNHLFRNLAVVLFIGLHIGFGLTLNIGIFPFLSSFSWLAFIPTATWDRWQKRVTTAERAGLQIYYDADCGFCKKVVHLFRTFLVLPGVPLEPAQSDPSIEADMQLHNSWVVVDYQGNRRFKFVALAYVIGLSPVLGWLAPVLNWSPLMAAGTRFYEAIANNRKVAGNFTKPFKFRAWQVNHYRVQTLLVLVLLLYTTLWNFSVYAPDLFKRRIWQTLSPIGRVTRLDQSWSIFAPGPPRDDGWHVIPGQLADGREVDIFRDGQPVQWEKLSLAERQRLYRNMQWRTFFINLNRGLSEALYPYYAQYLCRNWNQHHPAAQRLEQFDIYFMDERTVPPGQTQTVTKTKTWHQKCSA